MVQVHKDCVRSLFNSNKNQIVRKQSVRDTLEAPFAYVFKSLSEHQVLFRLDHMLPKLDCDFGIVEVCEVGIGDIKESVNVHNCNFFLGSLVLRPHFFHNLPPLFFCHWG